MTGELDLEVDTDWIRRSAGTLERVAARFRAVPGASCESTVESAGLGGSAEAAQVAALVNLRCEQADQAAAQLGAVSAGLATRLGVSADQFDRLEQMLLPRPR